MVETSIIESWMKVEADLIFFKLTDTDFLV